MVRVVDEDTYVATLPDGGQGIRLQLHLDCVCRFSEYVNGTTQPVTAIDFVLTQEMAVRIADALASELKMLRYRRPSQDDKSNQ